MSVQSDESPPCLRQIRYLPVEINQMIACRFLSSAVTSGLLILALSISGRTSWAGQAEPLGIGTFNQIFIDGRFMAEKSKVKIVVQRPRKTGERNIVSGLYSIVPGKPTICTDGPRFWAYQQVMMNDGVFKGFRFVSGNGVEWQEATAEILDAGNFSYGIYSSSGERAFGVVFADPSAPARERYKVVSGYNNKVFASADGLQWKVLHTGIFPSTVLYPYGMDSQNVAFFDQSLSQYVAYIRINKRVKPPPEHQAYFNKSPSHGQMNHIRCVGRLTTNDLSSFSKAEIVLEPDEADPIKDGVAVMDFYMPQVLKYPHAQDAYVMFPNSYLHYQDWFLADDLTVYYSKEGTEVYNAGPIDIGFAASRDGIHWERYNRKPLIALGKKGEFDEGGLYPVRGLIFHGDEMWLYYVASDGHFMLEGGHQFRNVMSRVVFREDGFTAVEAEYAGGEFTTPVLTFTGNELHLNVETSALGLVQVEVQDESGKPLPGFSLQDCDRIHTTNSTDRRVTWRKGHSDIGTLSSRPVRLRFELMYGAKLYAFRTHTAP